MRLRHILLVLAALLAGCTLPAQEAPATPPRPEEAPAPSAPVLLARPEHDPPASLPVALTLSQQWLKPFGEMEARVVAPAGARVAWFVEHEEVDARSTVVKGEVYVLKSTTPDHHNTQGKRTRADVDELAPDGRARSLRFAVPGRYHLEAEGARLVVNVWPDAPQHAPSQAFLFGQEGALRFEPAELDAPVGARVLLWSEAPRAVDVREVAYAAHVAGLAEAGRLTPIDEGLYHLTALAIGSGGGRGAARVPFLVDFERPSERLALGPATGRFLAPEAGVEDPHRSGFRAEHPLERLVLRVNATSPAPAPASVEVSLLREGEALAAISSLTSSELQLADLPAGEYVVRVRGEHGAVVGYEWSGEGIYRLPTPARLRETTA